MPIGSERMVSLSSINFASPDAQFFDDVNNNRFFTKDSRNFINVLSIRQLNTLGNVSLLDIYLSTSNIIEPHIHQNASELVYCISGAAVVSLINPFTKRLLNIPLKPGQVANVPQGWWHYEIATEDHTHLLAVFDAPVPEFIGGSDLLRLTPPDIFAHSYCLNEERIAEALAPLRDTVFIGPPAGCGDARPSPEYGHSHAGPAVQPYWQAPAFAPYDAHGASPAYGQGRPLY